MMCEEGRQGGARPESWEFHRFDGMHAWPCLEDLWRTGLGVRFDLGVEQML